ncbi:anaerobic benzoate catabolism transcriptional regulator [Kingella potus]|uniref:Anaerobic benzoate catabolism transcriptional regulator n=1 Tax=Kingella potus TaxID=265175 RepID=A0A377R3J8_9NEIS|nr:helix-turn-helix transcriptional regulator [Kingella potus]UOP00389.1 helix-turn-helix domain-containing protein [Kingella potus]STR02542.1 anaerobic benzoate catabolism transcriptional regulator [Kingella potus]
MKIYDKIRALREERQWSQEELAGRLGLSANGYAKIERGETRLNLPRLEQIAEIFDTDILNLIAQEDGRYNLSVNNIGDNISSDNYQNIYDSQIQMAAEIDKLQLTVKHQAEMLAQKDRELEALQEIIRLMGANRA